ncbi:DMT family transporter [Agathobaculum sp.]|uniref:DMT family transporter n=1 Tax=Agathobaculum sp. TaxID=2048138 RepID=UPI002A817027|nr:DMT family transporter [Agathobaculum sp.]MDY3619364.1 DMT family transporter [Agathobaculum sp.]
MTERKTHLARQLYIPALLCTALWGSAAPCVKTGYRLFAVAAGDYYAQLVFAGWRFLLAGLLVLVAARIKGRRILPRRDELVPIAGLSMFQTVIQYICYYIGLSQTTGVKGSVLSGTQTFFSVLLAHFLLKDDKITKGKAAGCALGFAGVLVLNLNSSGLGGFSWGDALVLVSAVSAGAGALVSRIVTPGRDPMLLTGWQLAGGGALLLIGATLRGGALGAVTPGGVALLAYMVVLSATAFTVWTALLGKFPVGQVALFGFCIPIFGALFSALVLGEQVFTLRNLAALVLVSGGIAAANYTKASKTG